MMADGDSISVGKDLLAEHIRDTLPHIDRYLAHIEVKINDRPLQATIEFVTHFIEAVDPGSGEATPPGDFAEFVSTKWFSVIFYHVYKWYQDRFSAILNSNSDSTILGLIEIAATPFAIKIPKTKNRPGKPGKSVWFSFPDGIRDDEIPINWVENKPNFELLEKPDRIKAHADAIETAGMLRYINTSLMAVAHSTSEIAGLMAGIIPRLERAASSILQEQGDFVQHAYWELQLSCESALKALRQQQAHTFIPTHDLFRLFDDTDPNPNFDREILKKMPRWPEAAAMRYGIGDRHSRRQCIETYRDSLVIVAGTVSVMHKIGIGGAEFEIARPPWYEFVDKSKI